MTLPADAQKKTIEDAGEQAIFSYNQTDFVKDRVALEVQFGKYAFVAYDLFVKHLAFFLYTRRNRCGHRNSSDEIITAWIPPSPASVKSRPSGIRNRSTPPR
ncbi:MAG: hypothetical protein LBP86_07705 [Azoarcus sp.]|nr:hypothetical protein [Azoarcus sp.]